MANRSTNWLTCEESTLAQEGAKYFDTITGKFSPNLSKATKKEAWELITAKVNAVGGQSRSVDKVQKKWSNLRSSTKHIVAQNSRSITQTGGGPPQTIPLTNIQELVSATIPQQCYEGIKGGIDLHDTVRSETVVGAEDSQPSLGLVMRSPMLPATVQMTTPTKSLAPTPTSQRSRPSMAGLKNPRYFSQTRSDNDFEGGERRSKRTRTTMMSPQELLLKEQVDLVREQTSLMRTRNEYLSVLPSIAVSLERLSQQNFRPSSLNANPTTEIVEQDTQLMKSQVVRPP